MNSTLFPLTLHMDEDLFPSLKVLQRKLSIPALIPKRNGPSLGWRKLAYGSQVKWKAGPAGRQPPAPSPRCPQLPRGGAQRPDTRFRAAPSEAFRYPCPPNSGLDSNPTAAGPARTHPPRPGPGRSRARPGGGGHGRRGAEPRTADHVHARGPQAQPRPELALETLSGGF